MEKDGEYVRVDTGANLDVAAEILRRYRFARSDFRDPQPVHKFLEAIMSLYYSDCGFLGSSVTLPVMMKDLRDWLMGTEVETDALKDLCQDPEFLFGGDTWTVAFNEFCRDGAVDQWTVTGRHDPKTNANEILTLDIAEIRPAGTFSYPQVFGP